MVSVKPWRTEALVRLALGVAVCVFMGVLGMSLLRLGQPDVRVNGLLFAGVASAGFLAFITALILTRRPFDMERSPRRLMGFLAILYLGFVLIMVAQKLTFPFVKFSASDLADLQSLARNLKQPADAVSAFLKTQLSAETLTALAEYREPDFDRASLQTALVGDLNRIIDGESLYDLRRFAGVALRPETKQLVTEKPRGAALVRLNRLLLEDAYPLEISGRVRVAPAQPGLWQMVLASLSFQGAALVMIGFFLREHQLGWSEGFGFRNGPARALGLGLVATLTILPVAWLLQMGFAALLIWLNFEAESQAAVQVLRDAPGWLDRLPLGLVAIVIAPPAEEMLFRGLLYPTVKRAGFPRLALWGTAFLFAAIHWNLPSFPSLVLLALVLTWLYEKTDNLLAPIAAHSLFNALNFVALQLYEQLPEHPR
jgi:membrane protease YdiL (CAAX protease family)